MTIGDEGIVEHGLTCRHLRKAQTIKATATAATTPRRASGLQRSQEAGAANGEDYSRPQRHFRERSPERHHHFRGANCTWSIIAPVLLSKAARFH